MNSDAWEVPIRELLSCRVRSYFLIRSLKDSGLRRSSDVPTLAHKRKWIRGRSNVFDGHLLCYSSESTIEIVLGW